MRKGLSPSSLSDEATSSSVSPRRSDPAQCICASMSISRRRFPSGTEGAAPPRTRSHRFPALAAAAAVCLQWFDCAAPAVRSVSAPLTRASATRNSSFRVLLPPNARPVMSSRFINMPGPPRCAERRSSLWTGVGVSASGNRGRSRRGACVMPIGSVANPVCGVHCTENLPENQERGSP